MTNYSEMYADTRENITDLVSGLDEAGANKIVPATPEWSVRQLIAHLAGVLGDILAGNLEGVATDPWTAVQVEARKDKTLAESIDEWKRHACVVEPMISNFPADGASTLCFDAYTHEQDIRQLLGKPANRSGDAFENALQRSLDAFGARLDDAGLGLRVASDGREWKLGQNPTDSVVGDAFHLMRGMSGRRSVEQIKAFDWDCDPEPYLAVFPLFGSPPTEALVE